jgi:hypothetical protein
MAEVPYRISTSGAAFFPQPARTAMQRAENNRIFFIRHASFHSLSAQNHHKTNPNLCIF